MHNLQSALGFASVQVSPLCRTPGLYDYRCLRHGCPRPLSNHCYTTVGVFDIGHHYLTASRSTTAAAAAGGALTSVDLIHFALYAGASFIHSSDEYS